MVASIIVRVHCISVIGAHAHDHRIRKLIEKVKTISKSRTYEMST